MSSVVLLTVDCLRADHVGAYGYNRPTTPNIDAFADNATLFTNAYSNCPGTRWAFQSLHTGVPTIRFNNLGIPTNYQPIAEQFKQAGYATGGFAANGFVSRDYNYDTGFDPYYSVQEATTKKSSITRTGKYIDNILGDDFIRERFLEPTHRLLRQFSSGRGNKQFTPDHTDYDTVSEALSFIRTHQEQGDDFFCWVHFMDAHTPYGYWPDHLKQIRGDSDIEHTIHPGDEGKVTPGRGPDPGVIDTYDAAIRRVDDQISRIFDELGPETTIVLTGDHGEEFGRTKDLQFHEASVYGSFTQVPIIVRTPEMETGVVDDPAQHLDIPPTLLAAAEIEIPSHYEGELLQALDRSVDEPIFFALSQDHLGVRQGNLKLIERDGDTELYQVPHMQTEAEGTRLNELPNESLKDELSKFKRKKLPTRITKHLESTSTDLSTEVEENLEDLGYR